MGFGYDNRPRQIENRNFLIRNDDAGDAVRFMDVPVQTVGKQRTESLAEYPNAFSFVAVLDFGDAESSKCLLSARLHYHGSPVGVDAELDAFRRAERQNRFVKHAQFASFQVKGNVGLLITHRPSPATFLATSRGQ